MKFLHNNVNIDILLSIHKRTKRLTWNCNSVQVTQIKSPSSNQSQAQHQSTRADLKCQIVYTWLPWQRAMSVSLDKISRSALPER